MKNLVIVESPAKAKTIEKFLGKDYTVMSSYGHIRDLSKKDISLDAGMSFEPAYEIPADKKSLVADLRKAARSADMVWLASDEDREGEAIAWHLYEVLGLKPENTKRIVFHEITKDAILNAIANPRDIDLNLVDAQQARRVLDRVVGFELSPVLWKKIRPSLSAGRVQSATVRLVVDREKEIEAFRSETFYRVNAIFALPDGTQVRTELSKRFPDEASARAFLEACADAKFTVADISVKPLRKQPAPPFTTSTLQQEAGRRLGFSVSQTMMIAQKLYEAGYITYMRTDSLNLSSLALGTTAALIRSEMGEKYLKTRQYHTKSKGAQEAHEAIRPTYIDRETIDGTDREKKLYRLIRLRTMASQMADAELEKTTVEISVSGRPEHFTASGEVLKFDGFMRVYLEGAADGTDADEPSRAQGGLLPPMTMGESLAPAEITATQRFTQAPPRYTEETLVKKMEEVGIGRPSTYASTISTIQNRGYINKGDKRGVKRDYEVLSLAPGGKVAAETRSENVGADKGKLIPTDTGMIVNEFLAEHFPDILDYDFTAAMEAKFDKIAEGDANWKRELLTFYELFHPEVEAAADLKTDRKVGERLLGLHPDTGEPVSVKIGRFGPIVQIGSADSDVKPRFASLRKDQSVFDITLPEALKLFDLPRVLGEYEGSEVSAAIGRFGPYIRHAGKFVSIPRSSSATTITLDEAIALIEQKRVAEANKVVKTFAEEPDIQILNGRYGVYIASGKTNYKIPKTVADPSALTLDEVRAIMAEQDKAPRKPRRAASKKK